MARIPLLALLSGLSLAAPAGALTVGLDPGSEGSGLEAGVLVSPGFIFRVPATPSGVPDAGSASTLELPIPQLVGVLEATIAYELSHAAFDLSFDTLRVDGDEFQAWASGSLYFSVDEDVGYALSGFYEIVDPRDLGVRYLSVDLVDLTTSAALYDYYAMTSVSAYFDLSSGGSGARTGALIAGHEYRLRFDARDYALYPDPGPPPDPQGVASTGSGALALVFVPEPPLAALLLVFLAAARRDAFLR